MLGLIERVKRAEGIQYFWNHCLTEQERKRLKSKEKLLNPLFRMAGCETQCTECLCIQETSISFVACEECGGDTVSPYYC